MSVRFLADENLNREIVTGLCQASSSCGPHLPVRVVIDDLCVVAEASDAAEWEGRVLYLPLR